MAEELNEALPGTVTLAVPGGVALETETGLAATLKLTIPGSQVNESDSAHAGHSVASYDNLTLSYNPWGYWGLEEGTVGGARAGLTANDLSPNNRDGTYGTGAKGADPLVVGSDSSLEEGVVQDLPLPPALTSGFTFQIWFESDTDGFYVPESAGPELEGFKDLIIAGRFIEFVGPADNYFAIAGRTTDHPVGDYETGPYLICSCQVAGDIYRVNILFDYTDANEHFITIRWSPTFGLTAILDGDQFSDPTGAPPPYLGDGSAPFLLGGGPTYGAQPGLKVGKAAFFTTVLTDEQIQAQYDLGAGNMFAAGRQAIEFDVALTAASIIVEDGVGTPTYFIAGSTATETDVAFGGESSSLVHVYAELELNGDGLLEISDELILVNPEFVLVVQDKILDRAPTSVPITMMGGIPNWPVDLLIDDTLVFSTTTDSDGGLSLTSLTVSATVGGAMGSHTVKAEQVLNAVTIIATDTYTMVRNPNGGPIFMGSDAQAVELPEAISHDGISRCL